MTIYEAKRAILTGFEPFGNYPFNPTQDLVKFYNGTTVNGIEIVGLVLPCSYARSFQVLSAEMDRLAPDMILETGFVSGALRIRLEAVGRNQMYHDRYADADGRRPDHEPIVSGGKPYYRTNADNVALMIALQEAGIPAEISIDADRFVCNALIYQTARRIEEEGLPIRHAYFHTPATEDYRGNPELAGKPVIPRGQLTAAIPVVLIGLGQMG